MLERIKNNAYKIDLQGKYAVSSTFNVPDLIPFCADESDLRSNPFKGGGDDATMTEPEAGKELNEIDIEEEHDELNPIDTQGVMGLAGDDTFQSNQDMDPFCLSKGPITRSQTRRLKKSIDVLVYSKPDKNQAKEPSQLFTYSVFGLV